MKFREEERWKKNYFELRRIAFKIFAIKNISGTWSYSMRVILIFFSARSFYLARLISKKIWTKENSSNNEILTRLWICSESLRMLTVRILINKLATQIVDGSLIWCAINIQIHWATVNRNLKMSCASMSSAGIAWNLEHSLMQLTVSIRCRNWLNLVLDSTKFKRF